MPYVRASLKDLMTLLHRDVDIRDIDRILRTSKTLIATADGDLLRLEVADANRPDLWSVEGIARQVSSPNRTARDSYPFFWRGPTRDVEVDLPPKHATARLPIAGFLARRQPTSADITHITADAGPITEWLGRRGTEPFSTSWFDVSSMTGPLRVSLCEDEPCLVRPDDAGDSAAGPTSARELLMICRFCDFRTARLCANMISADVADRGWQIIRVRCRSAGDDAMSTTSPCASAEGIVLSVGELRDISGLALSLRDCASALTEYGYSVSILDSDKIEAVPPPWRDDVMHSVDLVEDILLMRGLNESTEAIGFEPWRPSHISRIGLLEEAVKDVLAECGFTELMTHVLGPQTSFMSSFSVSDSHDVVPVLNPVSSQFNVARNSLLPGLLTAVQRNFKRLKLPLCLFEVGPVIVNSRETDPVDAVRVAAIMVGNGIGVHSIHDVLRQVCHRLNIQANLVEADHESYLSGRSAKIVIGGSSCGQIGQLATDVLQNWKITQPVVIIEFDLQAAS